MPKYLGDMAVGATVKIKLNGAAWIWRVVHQGLPSDLYDRSCDGTWLLLENVFESRMWHAVKEQNDYEHSDINDYLNGSFFRAMEGKIQSMVQQVRIPCRTGTGDSTYPVGTIPVRVFLLSGLELGFTGVYASQSMPKDGTKLDYFEYGPAVDDHSGFEMGPPEKKRLSGGGNPAIWWTRTVDVNDAGHPDRPHYAWAVTTKGQASSYTLNTPEGIRPAMIMTRDALVLDDGTVVSDQPPQAPSTISIPGKVDGGSALPLSWSAASDPDGNLSGYTLQRAINGGGWSQIYRGNATSFRDSITLGWQTVRYRVRAYDVYGLTSSWMESPIRNVTNNRPPRITSPAGSSGTDLGRRDSGFGLSYTTDDPDGDELTVTQTLDGSVLRTTTVAAGTSQTVPELGTSRYREILNGSHTLTITARDARTSAVWSCTFHKKVTAASITLTAPLAVDGDISLARLAIVGSIPTDAILKVEATNNGLDPNPVWQDVTDRARDGRNIVFTNHRHTARAAFNFRISVKRGPSDQGGYIEGVTGAFQ